MYFKQTEMKIGRQPTRITSKLHRSNASKTYSSCSKIFTWTSPCGPEFIRSIKTYPGIIWVCYAHILWRLYSYGFSFRDKMIVLAPIIYGSAHKTTLSKSQSEAIFQEEDRKSGGVPNNEEHALPSSSHCPQSRKDVPKIGGNDLPRDFKKRKYAPFLFLPACSSPRYSWSG